MSPKPISRQEAIEAKVNRYFTGGPCKNGHVSERWTLNGGCIECQTEARRELSERLRSVTDQA